MKLLRILIFLLTAIGLYSCNMYSERILRTGRNFEFNSLPVTSRQEYKIEPYDKISFRILTDKGSSLIESSNIDIEKPLNKNINYGYQTFLVEADGLCNLPKIGRIKIVDLTIKEAEKLLIKKYSLYYVNPYISLKVINRRVMVFTSGSTRGRVIQLKNPKTTLIEAIALSGGITEKSKVKNIKLIRGNLSNPRVYKFDLRRLEGITNTNFLLEANDIIFINQRKDVFERTLKFISPIYALINTTATIFILYRSTIR